MTEYHYHSAGFLEVISPRNGEQPSREIGITFQVGKQSKLAKMVLTPKRALEVAERLIAAASRELVERPASVPSPPLGNGRES